MAAWRSIDSAPKDGRDILLFAPACEFRGAIIAARLTVGHWQHDEGGVTEYRDAEGRWTGQDERAPSEGWLSWDGGFTEEYPPTLWMPLDGLMPDPRP